MIVTTPNPVLTSPAKPVETIDKRILRIVEEMKQALIRTKNPKGVGLAAPQIGIGLRIFITRPTESSHIRVFFNPELTFEATTGEYVQRPPTKDRSLRKDRKLEGCLSIPNVWGNLKRPQSVRLRYMDMDGQWKEEAFDGFMATIVQHETDHLNGILFTQRVLEQKEKLYRIIIDEDGEERLEEIEI